MKKINMLYDATFICNIFENTSLRSGLFFVAYNVLLGFLKRKEFDISLYAENSYILKKVLSECPEFKDCKIFINSDLDHLISILSDIKNKHKANNNNKIVIFIAGILISILKRLNMLYYNFTFNPDKIDVYFSPVKAVPFFIANKKNIKKYVILHDTIPLIKGFLKRKPNDWYYKLVKSINKTDTYFANSLYTKQDFIEYVPKINPANIKVIPLSTGKPYFRIESSNYINQIKRKYKIPTDKKYIFSLSNLDPRKNLIFAIKNFITFTQKNHLDDFIFVLGGSHFKDFEGVLNKSIENFGDLKDKIVRIGYVDDEDMSALYSGAEMFVFPSLYEGFGIPVLEAMKCGLPVICSNTTSLPEVIADCGIQINPHSDDEMIKAMEKMYYDRDFRAECVRKGLERAKLFTWSKCVQIISDEIRRDFNSEEKVLNNYINV